MLRKVKLYGELAEFVGHKEFEIKAETLSKAVSFLINNFDGIEKFMSPRYYQVKIGNYTISDLIKLISVPVIAGAGRGTGKILLGAALIGLAIINPAVGFGLGPGGLGGGFATASGAFSITAFAGNIGIGLVLMGVSEMLTPLPKQKDFSSEQDPRLSYNFSGTQNTSRAGTPVPICYGEIITGSVVISGAVDTQQVQA